MYCFIELLNNHKHKWKLWKKEQMKRFEHLNWLKNNDGEGTTSTFGWTERSLMMQKHWSDELVNLKNSRRSILKINNHKRICLHKNFLHFYYSRSLFMLLSYGSKSVRKNKRRSKEEDCLFSISPKIVNKIYCFFGV